MERLWVLAETLLPALVVGGGYGYWLGRVERRRLVGQREDDD